MADHQPKKTKKVCNQPDSKVTYYTRHIMILLDAVRRGFGERPGASVGDLKHEQKYILMKDMYVRHVDHDQIIEIIMNPGEQQAIFFRRLKEHLRQYDRHDHITVIYHGGRTGMFENDYKWTFRGDGPRTVDAYEVIRVLNDALSDCLLILECWVPDRLEGIWEPKSEKTTEIMFAGNSDKDGNFFETIHRSVQRYATKPTGKTKRTIPQITAKDYQTSSNTRRVWLKRTEKGSEKIVKRFAIIPDQVRRTHKLELVAIEIQGPDNSNLADSDDGDGSDDDDGDNGGGGGGAGDQGDGDDGNCEGNNGESGDHGGNEDGDTRGGPGLGRSNDGDDQDMRDRTTNDAQDGGEDSNERDAMWRELRSLPGRTPDSPEATRLMRRLLNLPQPDHQQVKKAPKRQRLFGRQLPPAGAEGGEVIELSDGDEEDDGESLFVPRNGPAAKRAKRLARTPSHNPGRSINIMDLGDEDETANYANSASLIERLVDRNHNNDGRRFSRAASHLFSPIPKEEKKDDIKRSTSPSFDLGGVSGSSDLDPIKRERSNSPGVEITGSKRIRRHFDPTLDGELVDLTQEHDLQ